jgi:hypothetical protein
VYILTHTHIKCRRIVQLQLAEEKKEGLGLYFGGNILRKVVFRDHESHSDIMNVENDWCIVFAGGGSGGEVTFLPT